ncbi:hypothetical protein GGS20DRAFT_593668 [Poronia punctata]|nr:hypothetical protein GGS20DRAFT_593668 [Poronia punctata]
MAVLNAVPGVEVTVQVDGKDCIEYEPDQEEKAKYSKLRLSPSVTKYIECIDGAEFVIKIRVNNNYNWGPVEHMISARAQVDGQYIISRLLRNDDEHREGSIHCLEEYSPVTKQWTRSKLQFAAVETVKEEDESPYDKKQRICRQTGTITVTISRKIEVGRRPAMKVQHTFAGSHDGNLLRQGEKSAHGGSISHGTKFTHMEDIEQPTRAVCDYLPPDRRPIGVFNFLYRSRDKLEQALIIPKRPNNESFGHLSLAEMQLFALKQYHQAKDKKIKNESNAEIKVKTKDEIKQENPNLSDTKSKPLVRKLDSKDEEEDVKPPVKRHFTAKRTGTSTSTSTSVAPQPKHISFIDLTSD